MGMVYTAVM